MEALKEDGMRILETIGKAIVVMAFAAMVLIGLVYGG